MAGDDGAWLFERIQRQLRHDWEEYRELYANSKGDTYEQSLSDFLDSYFGGVYDINTKCAVIDENLRCFEEFDFVTGDDEIDVVSSFSQAKPRVIFETGEDRGKLRWIPFEAVAFICEVKSKLTKTALEGDFDKLQSISTLSDEMESRFNLTVSYDYSVTHPLQCLVYDEESIANDTFSDILHSNLAHWDLLLIVENDVLLINRSLPISENFVPSSPGFGIEEMAPLPPDVLAMIEETTGTDTDPDIISLDNGLFWFLTTISASIPDPLAVNTVNSLSALSQNTTFHTKVKTEFDRDDSE
jgi:hypothetical protein